MNLYTYELLYLDRHQDLLAAAAETQLAKLAQENLAKTNQKSPKFIDDFFQKVGQRIVGIYYELCQRGKSLNLKKRTVNHRSPTNLGLLSFHHSRVGQGLLENNRMTKELYDEHL